jgi:very-short-patch-repair endonuclease
LGLRKHPTPSEALLWEHLQGRSLCGARFRSQHPVETFIFDFYCPESRLVIEVDGGIHEQPMWRITTSNANGIWSNKAIGSCALQIQI